MLEGEWHLGHTQPGPCMSICLAGRGEAHRGPCASQPRLFPSSVPLLACNGRAWMWAGRAGHRPAVHRSARPQAPIPPRLLVHSTGAWPRLAPPGPIGGLPRCCWPRPCAPGVTAGARPVVPHSLQSLPTLWPGCVCVTEQQESFRVQVPQQSEDAKRFCHFSASGRVLSVEVAVSKPTCFFPLPSLLHVRCLAQETPAQPVW